MLRGAPSASGRCRPASAALRLGRGRGRGACFGGRGACGAAALPRPGGRSLAAGRAVALDAAQPFDFEALASRRIAEQAAAADRLVLATSRADYSAPAAALGVDFYGDAEDFVEQQPDVVILCTSILSLEGVLRAFPAHRLRRSTLVADVLSVKAFPKNLFLAVLPPSLDIVCLHPMFGPESGKASWQGLPLVFDRVRVGDDPARSRRCDALLRSFQAEGCRMVEMSCEEHDRLAASSQFITHTVGRMLGAMALPDTPINTRGYESLLSLVANTSKDSFDLYYGLFMYNSSSTEELARMEAAFDGVKRQLFDQLHALVRGRILHEPPAAAAAEEAVDAGAAAGLGGGVGAQQQQQRQPVAAGLLPAPPGDGGPPGEEGAAAARR